MPHRAGRNDLKPAQRLALAALSEETTEELTRGQYEQLTGVSRSQAAYDLAELVEGGLVERVGGGRSTRYRRPRRSQPSQRHWTNERIRAALVDLPSRRPWHPPATSKATGPTHRPMRLAARSAWRNRLLGLGARLLAAGSRRAAKTADSFDPATAALGRSRHGLSRGAVRSGRRRPPPAAPHADPRRCREARQAGIPRRRGQSSDLHRRYETEAGSRAATGHAQRLAEHPPGTLRVPRRARGAEGLGPRPLTGEAVDGWAGPSRPAEARPVPRRVGKPRLRRCLLPRGSGNRICSELSFEARKRQREERGHA